MKETYRHWIENKHGASKIIDTFAMYRVYQMKIGQCLGYHLKCFDKMYNLDCGIRISCMIKRYVTDLDSIWTLYLSDN